MSIAHCSGAKADGPFWLGLVSEQVESAADSPAHAGDAVVNVLERLRVADVVQAVWPATATRSTPLARLVATLPEGESPTVAVLEGDRLVGIGPFLFALYFFFQNVNRLLPPGL